MESFSDFAQESHNLQGVKCRMCDIINRPIVATAMRLISSKVNPGRECLQLQFYHQDDQEEKLFVVFTTSEVLTRQAQQYADHMPFKTIVRHNKYYTFS